MGLTVTAYSHMRYVADYVPWWEEKRFRRWHEVRSGSFPFRMDGFEEGWYECSGEEVKFDLNDSGFGEWRRWLAEAALGISYDDVVARHKELAQHPFVRLLVFPDWIGSMGPETSARLASDFGLHGMTLLANADPVHADVYRKFTHAFETATQNGFVVFR